jgi:hypothetical protein
MNQRSMIAFNLALAVLTGVVVWRAQERVQAPSIALDVPRLNCTFPPTFSAGYQREFNGVAPAGQGFNFQGLSWIQADLCSPGILQLTAAGQVANGENPILQIALNSETLASEAFDKRRSLKIRVPHPGRLTLGYFNDFYRSDARVATLENLSFSGLDCKNLNVDVPRATGGQWAPSTRTASLVSSVPMTVIPCSAGTLSLRTVGSNGAKVFPLLEFRQQGKLLLNIQTGVKRKAIQLKITTAPLTITLINPYFKQVADRNLLLFSVKYYPDSIKAP